MNDSIKVKQMNSELNMDMKKLKRNARMKMKYKDSVIMGTKRTEDLCNVICIDFTINILFLLTFDIRCSLFAILIIW